MKFKLHPASLACGLIMLLCSTGLAQQHHLKNEVNFLEGSLDKALTMAKQQHKPVFIDAFASWCAPCKQLKNETFKDKAVAAYFNAHFINISIDVEKGDGEKFAEQYLVNSYPTLLFVDTDGKVIKRMEGFVDEKTLQSVAININ